VKLHELPVDQVATPRVADLRCSCHSAANGASVTGPVPACAVPV
jgi:hypothetical protein